MNAAAGSWWRTHRLALVMGAPAVAFLVVFFALPVLRLLMLSIEGGTLTHYEKALGDRLYLQVLWETIRIATFVTVVCLILGYPLAHFLATASPVPAAIGLAFLLLPFWTSVLVRTYAWMILLGRNGVLNRTLLDWGVIDRPMALLNNETGVVIGMVHVLLPYMVFPIYGVMRRVDRDLMRAAEGLGAPAIAVFRRIYFPLTLPGVIAGSTLVFVLSLGFFITPALLGGGRVMMVGVLIEQQIRQFLNWEFAAALSTVLLATALALYALLRRLPGGDIRWH
jgi:ABC-type spermidine/putrescine transport system permease subunit I